MSEKLFRFMLSELKFVRLLCQKPDCGSVTEVSLEKLRNGAAAWTCGGCGQNYFSGAAHTESPISHFAKSIQAMQDERNGFKIEFALPIKD